MSNKLRSHGKSAIVWVLLAMLVLGLGGFGISNFGGRMAAIGSIGETDVTVNDFARAMRNQMNAAAQNTGRPMTLDEARAVGLDQQVKAALFGEAALNEAARLIGISAGDQELHKEITSAEAFQGLDGKFDRETYRLTLRQQGFTEAQFETNLRQDIGRSILQGAVASGVPAPSAASDAYLGFIGETRDLVWAEVTQADLTEALPDPTEDELTAFHKDHADAFTAPETRQITYVWLTPAMLLDQASPDEATLRATYDARIDEYVQPEKRIIDRLVYPTADEATAAKARVDAGEATFADLAQSRGLTLDDTDMGEVSKAELGAAGDAVFGLDAPGVVGPIDTDLGPALFSMNVIIAPQETTFEEVRDELAAEAGNDRARRMIGDMTSDLEDRVAGGSTLEQIAEETDMQLGWISLGPNSEEEIAGYEEFRTVARKVTQEDFPELANLPDGGLFALRLDGITPAAVIPFDVVRDQVAAAWRADQLAQRKQARAEEIAASLSAETALGTTGMIVTKVTALNRGGFVEGAPMGFGEQVFALAAVGDASVVSDGETIAVAQLVSINPVDAADPKNAQIRTMVDTQLAQSLAGDVLDYYARAIQAEAGLSLDTAAINAVLSQMQ